MNCSDNSTLWECTRSVTHAGKITPVNGDKKWIKN